MADGAWNLGCPILHNHHLEKVLHLPPDSDAWELSYLYRAQPWESLPGCCEGGREQMAVGGSQNVLSLDRTGKVTYDW